MTTTLISRPWQNGYDAGLNGVNQTNCHFSNFATPEDRDQWESGKRAGEQFAQIRQFATVKFSKFMQQRRSEFLLTRDEFSALKPRDQGFCSYMQALWIGSQIPALNPFTLHSDKWKQFQEGEEAARQLVRSGK
jgi:ribosome modulation factor